MALEQIYYIAEIVAVVGILFSLVLVLLQLRQTQRQLEKSQVSTELANELNVSQNVHNIFLKLVEDAELRRVLRKARMAEEPLTGEEQGLYSAFAFVATFTAQASNMAWVNGMATDEMNSSHSASVCDLLNCDQGRKWLRRNENRFDPAYRATLKGLAGLGPIMAPGLPDGYPLPDRHDFNDGST